MFVSSIISKLSHKLDIPSWLRFRNEKGQKFLYINDGTFSTCPKQQQLSESRAVHSWVALEVSLSCYGGLWFRLSSLCCRRCFCNSSLVWQWLLGLGLQNLKLTICVTLVSIRIFLMRGWITSTWLRTWITSIWSRLIFMWRLMLTCGKLGF